MPKLKNINFFCFLNSSLLTNFEKHVEESFEIFMNENEIALVEKTKEERSKSFETLPSS
jgi:hypothetical protein